MRLTLKVIESRRKKVVELSTDLGIGVKGVRPACVVEWYLSPVLDWQSARAGKNPVGSQPGSPSTGPLAATNLSVLHAGASKSSERLRCVITKVVA